MENGAEFTAKPADIFTIIEVDKGDRIGLSRQSTGTINALAAATATTTPAAASTPTSLFSSPNTPGGRTVSPKK